MCSELGPEPSEQPYTKHLPLVDLETELNELLACVQFFLKGYYRRQIHFYQERLANFDQVNWSLLIQALADEYRQHPVHPLCSEDTVGLMIDWIETTLTD